MALTHSFDKFGTTFAGAYFRISNLNYDVNEYQETTYPDPSVDEDGNPVLVEPTTEWVTTRNASFQVKVYVDAAARTSHSEPVYIEYHTFTPDWTSSDNVLAQAYNYLKTLDAFDGAVDA